jgi:hypothetical protein
MRIGLHMVGLHPALLDDGVMHLLTVLSRSLLPRGYRAFIHLKGMHNRLEGAAIRQ